MGWLDNTHPFPKGVIDAPLIEKIRKLAVSPVELYRGFHICELCVEPPDRIKSCVSDGANLLDPDCSWVKWADQRRSNGEIRVAREGVTFAAPVLIIHYIEEHGYLPPDSFLKAIEEAVC